MSLLPQTASFEELVQECFLAHRGAGLMLSPLDVELVMRWSEAQVPFEVVARGIKKAAERALWDARPGEPALRTLRSCRKDVEAEIKKYRVRAVGAHQVADEETGEHVRSFEEERNKKLRAMVAKLGRERAELAGACEGLLSGVLSAPPSDLKAADRQEEWVLAALLRALPFAERLGLYKEAAHLAGEDRLASAQARTLSRRFHRQALIRRAVGLPSFW